MSNRGNALFLILIAVALFAALAYAVTQSSRGGGSVSKEQMKLDVARIVGHAASVQQAASRLMLSGCRDFEIDPDNDPGDNHYNTLAPSDGSCDLFSPQGAGLVKMPAPARMTLTGSDVHPYFSSIVSWEGIGTTGNADSNADLVMIYINLTEEACVAINKFLNPNAVTHDVENWGSYGSINGFAFYDNQGVSDNYGGSGITMADAGGWCTAQGSWSWGNYAYIHVIVAR